jgi:hypothetical protein
VLDEIVEGEMHRRRNSCLVSGRALETTAEVFQEENASHPQCGPLIPLREH